VVCLTTGPETPKTEGKGPWKKDNIRKIPLKDLEKGEYAAILGAMAHVAQ